MDTQLSKDDSSTTFPDNVGPTKRMVQNFFLVWIDANIDESKADFHNSLSQLRSVVNDVSHFTQEDEAIDFFTDIQDMSGFLIATDTIGDRLVWFIHDIPWLDTIYILANDQHEHKEWIEKWAKIQGIHTNILSICNALESAVKQCDQDSIPLSFVDMTEGVSNINLNQLEPSFMYTQLFKEILFEMNDEESAIKVLTDYCRGFYRGNRRDLKIIDEFEQTYRSKSPIWWYTRECFLYRMLNHALRELEGNTIMNMGFFMRDLHRQIQELHSQQINTYSALPFTVYRGQGLSKPHFDKMITAKGLLLSFNNFLSTSAKHDVSLSFAERAATKTDLIGVLFKMNVDPSVSYTPFASISHYGYYKTEEEILFSMHTIFRVGEINKITSSKSLYQVDLTLTADDDKDLRILTQRMREELVGNTALKRLGQLLIQISQLDKAEEVYNTLRIQRSEQDDEASYYHHLGMIHSDRGDYQKAIQLYTRAVEIKQKTLPANHPSLATSYSNMAGVYKDMGEYSKALSLYEKAVEIQQKTLPANHPSLATSYSNMAGVYRHMGEYSKALSLYEKAVEIQQKTLPANHPSLATCYGSMGGVYKDMGDYSKALSLYEKAVEIKQKTLPANHPSLATSYSNMAGVYKDMGDYSKAFSLYEKAVEIDQKTLPANHPSLATSYSNMAGVYKDMGEYSKALSLYEKAVEIQQKTLPANHPSLATCYGSMGGVYKDMGDYSKALSLYEKAVEIKQKTLPANHPSLAASYNNIAVVHYRTGFYVKSISFLERARDIWRKLLPANHRNFVQLEKSIEIVKQNL